MLRLWLRTIRLSAKSLLLHPLRSSLTVLGMFIGVSSVVWLLAIGEGISVEAQRQIAALGARNIIVRTVKPSGNEHEGGAYGLTRADYVRLVATLPTLDGTLPIREIQAEFRNRRLAFEGRLVGCTPDYADMTRLVIDRGRWISDVDLDEEKNNCVVAAEAAVRLFPGDNSLDKIVQVDDGFYTIVGVMQPRASSAGIGGSLAAEDYSKDVYVPITTLWRRFGDMIVVTKPGQFQRDTVEISQITLQVDDVDNVLDTAEVVQNTLDHTHTLPDFAITVPLELLEQARTTRLMFIIFLGLIAAISLVVGGIGIMNIMLATVTERTREIGIRRALGAKRSDITRQFLSETVLLSVAGGALGVLGGLFCRPVTVWGRELLANWRPDLMSGLPDAVRSLEPVLVPWSIPLAFSISVVIGVVFGVYPARRAALMDPIEALRHE